MKKLLLTAALVAVLGFAATAQEQGDIRVGGGLALGTKAAVDENGTKAGLGINLGGEYFVTDIISIAPSYTFFFKSTIDQPDGFGGNFESSIRYGSFNIDGRYYFSDGMFYGLAGLGIVSVKAEVSGFGAGSESEVGLNLGGGVMYPLSDTMFLNGQLKYNTADLGDGSQLVINAGVLFTIGG